MDIEVTLNKEQNEAVRTIDGPLLIIAGAGSGKTRVLTHRTAYLIKECGVAPWNICAITFTNKAAGEMRERIDRLVGFGSEGIWVATFHASCVRILRRFADRVGYGTNFAIYDADDQLTLMKRLFKERRIDTQMMKERGNEYIEAAQSINCSKLRIIFIHLLPNCISPIIVQATMSIATAIMCATGLSFLGLGVPAPTPEWGSMASSARQYFRDYWWLVTFPGLAIMASAFAFNLLGDGLRDALDPKLKR